MNLLEKLEMIKRMDALVRRRATGSPSELSHKLSISKRNVFYIINTMKDMGAPVSFCKSSNSYFYEEDVVFNYGFQSKGGSSKVNRSFFSLS